MSGDSTQEPLWSTDQTAAFLHIPPATLRQWAAPGRHR
jgi:hypothetical protein